MKPIMRTLAVLFALAAVLAMIAAPSNAAGKPNILVIWGDDIGRDNISAYSLGIMGYQTPNIDRIAKEGALFSFATEEGNIATAVRNVPGWPVITNLRADPYERASSQSGMYIRWYGDNIWLFIPVQQKLKAFLTTLPEYPFQPGSSLNAAGINYNSILAMQAMKRLKELESLSRPLN